jgi:hypothetical protein
VRAFVAAATVATVVMAGGGCGPSQVDPGDPNGNPKNIPTQAAPEKTTGRRKPNLYMRVWWSPDPKKRPVEIDWTATGTWGGGLEQMKSPWTHTIPHWGGGDAVILTRLLENGWVRCQMEWGNVGDEEEKFGLTGPARCEIHTVGDQHEKA